MDRLKVLFLTCDFSQYVQRSFHHFARALAEFVDLTVWHEPGHIRDITDRLPERPDYALLNDPHQFHAPPVDGLADLDVPLGVIMHDPHYFMDRRKAFYRQPNVRHIFTIYRDPFLRWYPEFVDRMRWLPHFADTSVFRDDRSERDIDILLLGHTSRLFYPLRRLMLDRMKDRRGFHYEAHPGYRNFAPEEEQRLLVNESYARAINRAKIFLTCDSVLHYPLRKYYEVLACRTLLLAPASSELADLGFIPGTHFVDVTAHDFEAKADEYLRNEAERERIADAGYRFVRERHTVRHRAKQFADEIRSSLSADGHRNADYVRASERESRGNDE